MKPFYKKVIKAAVFVAAALIICFFAEKISKKTDDIKVSKTGEYFGTVINISLYGQDEKKLEKIIDNSLKMCDDLEKIFSAKRQDSELYKLNQKAYNEEVRVSDQLFYVMDMAKKYEELSGYSLDTGMGKLIDLWNNAIETGIPPEDEQLDKYKDKKYGSFIELNSEKKTARFLNEDVKIDLGAIAKGYGADLVKKYIKSEDENIYGVLNFGGNVMTINEKKNGEPFNIAITDPFNPSDIAGTIKVRDKCVVTSGNYERYFIYEGKRYHHIINPATAYPAESRLVSTTVVGENSAQCDALSTICYILGSRKAMELINGISGVEAVFIDENGKMYFSEGFSMYDFKKK